MGHLITVAWELVCGLGILFVILKLLGKTQFSQITPFDFISALILGELVGNAVYDKGVRIWEIIFASLLWGVLIFLIELITQKVKGSRKLLEGEPNIVIRKGKLKYDVLKKNKLDINQLQSLLRQANCFSIQEVEYAILETNGLVSVLPKFIHDTPTNGDLQIKPKQVTLPVTLIIDGEVLYENLKEAGLEERQLKEELKKRNINRAEDVLFAEWKADKPIYVLPYEEKK
ncbi:YetF domain-containing protein [Bacillus nakamurai]|uniref:YetF domain-containing protein n=1 Tax=Bacillus nakamurai TaxID=1793963 RepID=UPI001E4828C2|nr:DUF421 domain-containing protein [Bacillus nakamurai]MCC9021999.1 DUF421 domain-containing protein [Bacillus nakamurai]MCP6681870.1 DUF421 domain-containing protein [Bacillus nakamurai]